MEKTRINHLVDIFVTRLKRRVTQGSFHVSRETAQLLRAVVQQSRAHSVQDLLEQVKSIGRQLVAAQPLELTIGNIVRRVLYVIREESDQVIRAQSEPSAKVAANVPSLQNLLEGNTADYSQVRVIKPQIIQAITEELIDELEIVFSHVAEQAVTHIHANEVVMTFGESKTVEEFLKAAARTRRFDVIVVESGPSFAGQRMARDLAAAKISTTVVTDAAAFAMMARVNKVVVGVHSVMANGGVVSRTGGHMLALAAHLHSVPFVVVTGLYKLSPLYPIDQNTINDLQAPSDILTYEEVNKLETKNPSSPQIRVVNPAFDYIPPQLVSLFVTNYGGHNPSYIYRLLAEYYHVDDYRLD